VFTQLWPTDPADKRRDQSSTKDRAERALRGIGEKIGEPTKLSPARPRSSATGSDSYQAAPRRSTGHWRPPRRLPQRQPVTAEFVTGAYHRLFQTWKSFWISKHDMQARQVYHDKRDSIEAHSARSPSQDHERCRLKPASHTCVNYTMHHFRRS
jgi:hypothetical protein